MVMLCYVWCIEYGYPFYGCLIVNAFLNYVILWKSYHKICIEKVFPLYGFFHDASDDLLGKIACCKFYIGKVFPQYEPFHDFLKLTLKIWEIFCCNIKHEYLRSRAYICLSLSSPFSSVTVIQIWPLSRYSCFYLGSLHPRNF